jgi:phosphate transport system permease protein
MIKWRKFKNTFFSLFCFIVFLLGLVPLLSIIQNVIIWGLPHLDLNFFLHASRPIGEEGGGMAHAIIGSIIILFFALLMAIPIGIGCGTFLAEYPHHPLARLSKNILETMAGLPSIVIGMLCFSLVVLPFKHFSALAASLSLLMIMLPIILL